MLRAPKPRLTHRQNGKPGELPRPAPIVELRVGASRYLAERPVICSVVSSLKLPLPLAPLTSDVLIAY